VSKLCADCKRPAVHFIIFEATLAPGIHPRMPHKWLCKEHCDRVWAEVQFEGGAHKAFRSVSRTIDLALFQSVYDQLKKRSPDAWREREKTGEPIPILLCPSKLTEVEVRELEQAFADGRTIKEGRAPDVEYMSPEEAAREIARTN